MWSVHFIGKPEAIKRAIGAYNNSLQGEDRIDFSRVRYALEQLLDMNSDESLLSLNASNFNGSAKGVQVVLMQSNATHVQ